MAQLIKVVVKHFVSIKCSMGMRYKKVIARHHLTTVKYYGIST